MHAHARACARVRTYACVRKRAHTHRLPDDHWFVVTDDAMAKLDEFEEACAKRRRDANRSGNFTLMRRNDDGTFGTVKVRYRDLLNMVKLDHVGTNGTYSRRYLAVPEAVRLVENDGISRPNDRY